MQGENDDDDFDDDSTEKQNGNQDNETKIEKVMSYKEKAIKEIDMFFESQDCDAVCFSVIEIGSLGEVHDFVRFALRMALERGKVERELVSRLISDIRGIVAADQIGKN